MAIQWMQDLSKNLENCGAKLNDSLSISTSLDYEKTLDLNIQFDGNNEKNILLSVHMRFLPQEDEFENEHYMFSSAFNINTEAVSPQTFAAFITKLYQMHFSMMYFNFDGKIDQKYVGYVEKFAGYSDR